jgi:hypothetical protein
MSDASARPVPWWEYADGTSGDLTVTLEVAVRGAVDAAAAARLDALLTAMLEVPAPVVVEVADASCDSGRLVRALGRFRAARRAGDRGCRLRGLHAGIAPDLDQVELGDLVALFAESHGS